MAGLGSAFDPNSVKPDTGGSGGVHPEGIFEFEIQESDVKPTSNGKGTVLSATLVGTGHTDAPSDNKGRKVWINLNIAHESSQAQAIGQAQLSALCAAMQFTEELADSEQLHYQPFWAEVKHEQQKTKASGYKDLAFNDDGSPKMNAVIKRYMFEGMEEAAPSNPPASKPAATKPPAAPAAANKSRPWSKAAA